MFTGICENGTKGTYQLTGRDRLRRLEGQDIAFDITHFPHWR